EELFGDKENGSRCFRVVLPPALNALLTPVLAEKGHLHQAVIEFQVPASQDFRLAHKELDHILKRAQVRPLAVGVHRDRQLLQF
ncbi:hypothetical protein ONK20_25735, partial [Salmonella enterica subsp. enterica serovar Montevideo]|nr:hypothetical protein [Salmonella enterica subsp. enterica serovar Montevideo]